MGSYIIYIRYIIIPELFRQIKFNSSCAISNVWNWSHFGYLKISFEIEMDLLKQNIIYLLQIPIPDEDTLSFSFHGMTISAVFFQNLLTLTKMRYCWLLLHFISTTSHRSLKRRLKGKHKPRRSSFTSLNWRINNTRFWRGFFDSSSGSHLLNFPLISVTIWSLIFFIW